MDPRETSDAYLAALADRVDVIRGEGASASVAASVPARVHEVVAKEMERAGGVVSYRGKAIVLHAALVAAEFPLPLRIGDRLKQDRHVWTIVSADDTTRRVGSTVIAWELVVEGA